MYRDPKPEELNDPLFERIWQTIKSWDINIPSEYNGYMGATGNHVCAILDAVRATPSGAGAMREALEFAKGAIQDAIKLEDGLDGAEGTAVIGMIDRALAGAGVSLDDVATYVALRLPERLPLRGDRSEAKAVILRLMQKAGAGVQCPNCGHKAHGGVSCLESDSCECGQ